MARRTDSDLQADENLPREYVRALSSPELQLLILRKVLYDGDWNELERDLVARRDGKPYIFKLRTRIDEDLVRIEKLKAYEREHGVDLSEYLPDPEA